MSQKRNSWSVEIRKPGFSLVAMTLLVQLAAWNTGTNLLYVVLAGLYSFVGLSLVLPVWSLYKVSLQCEAPAAVHRGEAFGITVIIENHKRVMPAVSIRLETDGDEQTEYVVEIPPSGQARLALSRKFDKRGVYCLSDFIVASSFPFGLLEVQRRFGGLPEVVVYPRILPVRTAETEILPGATVAVQFDTGDSDEFFSLREYVPGDSIRFIAWRASARKGELLVRDQAPGMSRLIAFIMDTYEVEQGEEFEERFEEMIELVASLAVTLLNRNTAVSLLSPSAKVPLGEGKSQEFKVLDLLARIQPEPPSANGGYSPSASEVEGMGTGYIYASADSSKWGNMSPVSGARVLDPREVVCA